MKLHTNKQLMKIHTEGMKAYKQGILFDDNPYKGNVDVLTTRNWENGWRCQWMIISAKQKKPVSCI